MALQSKREIKKIENGLERGERCKKIISYNNSSYAFGNNNTQPYQLK